MATLTQEKAIEHYTELMRRVQVGAYLELHHDGSFPEDDGSAESTTLESLANLENWAARRGLEFEFNVDSQTWSLTPIEQEHPGPDYESIETRIQELREEEESEE